MKRMVKNGDLLDISENGSATFGSNLKVGGTIIANGEIRGGDVSATKFYLGTEEMPLVKANPAGDATGTLEKIKIGNVSYNVGGGGGGSNDREISLTMPYPSTSVASNKKLYLDEQTWNNINNLYYDTIKLYFNDGKPIGVFHVINYKDTWTGIDNNGFYVCISSRKSTSQVPTWYGQYTTFYAIATIKLDNDSSGKYLSITQQNGNVRVPDLLQSSFDALYKLADKPTQDGTYVLKATVSGGAVTYTWVAE